MSRFSIDPPDEDRYSDKPIDAQDIDVPEILRGAFYTGSSVALPLGSTFSAGPSDPAEHAAHALIEALATLDQEIATATTLERANVLRKMMKRAWADVTRVTDNAGDKVDRLVEKLR